MKKCPVCNEPILGRIDKKYCSDLCRNAHNNEGKFFANQKMRHINVVLRKNRRILEKLIEQQETVVTKESLLLLDFNFSYITNFSHGPSGSYTYFCYEFGYVSHQEGIYELVKR
ncbi:MAG: hypothetical protein ACJ77K_06515 [Bacteroidia bacterium]